MNRIIEAFTKPEMLRTGLDDLIMLVTVIGIFILVIILYAVIKFIAEALQD